MSRRLSPLLVGMIMIFVIMFSQFVISQPTGAQVITNSTETKAPAVAEYLNTSGGTFTTLILSAETQTFNLKFFNIFLQNLLIV